MSWQRAIRVGPDVVSQEIGDGLVLLNLRTGVYWGLNETGAAIWWEIERHRDFDRICAALHERFDATKRQVATAVRGLLDELAGEELIVTDPAGGQQRKNPAAKR